MLLEKLLLALAISLLVFLIHYYTGTIDIWYMPCIELLIGIICYELFYGMYSSYKDYKKYINRSNNVVSPTPIGLDEVTRINTLENSKRSEQQIIDKLQSVNFNNVSQVKKFRADEKIINDIEFENGVEEEQMTDTSISETEEREKYT
jgi:hypothetical protein|uniref:Uncharacterized protein n=1 Tax=viral metagenome TaxID=1070528 RepID=A0A6C0J256_9ZZZZ